MTDRTSPETELAKKIELHLQLDSSPGFHLSTEDLQMAARALRETLEADAALPCDVRLPPVTTISRGCSYKTLMLAIAQRSNWQPGEAVFRPAGFAPTPTQPELVSELADVAERILILQARREGMVSAFKEVADYLQEQKLYAYAEHIRKRAVSLSSTDRPEDQPGYTQYTGFRP